MMFGKEYRDLADMLLNNERAKKFYMILYVIYIFYIAFWRYALF